MNRTCKLPELNPKPIVTYRGHTVIGMPPPSSGGIHVAQILNMLEQFPVRDMYLEQPAQYIHHVAEAMKLAFADRMFYLGDRLHLFLRFDRKTVRSNS